MISAKKNIVRNILISAGDNRLQLCDIIFDSKIREVKPASDTLFEWNKISDMVNRNKILSRYVKQSGENDFLLAMPGAIDSHVHFDTPGFEFREDFEHASAAAAAGGVTTVIDMPCTSVPPVTTAENFEVKRNAVSGRSYVDYAFWGGVSGNVCGDLYEAERNLIELSEMGAAGFKAYLMSGMDTFKELNQEQMSYIASVINRLGKPLAVHAEDKNLISFKIDRFVRMGKKDWQAYCQARDEQAEGAAVDTMISIARAVNCKIHLVHLSSALAVRMLEKARQEGICITAETCPHYLYFTQKDFENPEIRNFLKTAPPVKFEEDKDALWRALSEGILYFVTTDHAGCNPDEEKTSTDFWKVYGGIPGVEHRVPFLFSEGFLKGKLSLEQTIKLLSTNQAVYFRLPGKGFLQASADADFSLIDLWDSRTVKASDMHSRGRYTPFEGAEFKAVVKRTYLRGNLVYDNGRINPDKLTGELITVH